MEDLVELVSSDGKPFRVARAAADLSRTLSAAIEDTAGSDGCIGSIPVPEVRADMLERVVAYLERHNDSGGEEKHSDWDAEYIRNNSGETSTLIGLTVAANYLDIPGLLDLACHRIAELMRGKTTEQLREMLGVVSDLTPEEDEQIRRENEWVLD